MDRTGHTMNERDWILLKTLAEERKITRTAECLYISQPAITYRLRMLERELGTTLAIRTPIGVILTPQGEYLAEYSREMLLRLTKTKEHLASFEKQVKGPLRIGSSAIFANHELPQLLQGFMQQYPKVEILLKTGRSMQVNRYLVREEVSVAIIRGEYDWQDEKRLLFEEPVCLVSKTPVIMEDLPSLPRIVYDTDSSLQATVDEWWRKRFAKPSKESMVVDSMDTCKRMVMQNLGWAILPSIGLSELDKLYVQPLYWQNKEPFVRRTWICCGSYALELPTVRAFIEYATACFKDKARPSLQAPVSMLADSGQDEKKPPRKERPRRHPSIRAGRE